MLIIVDSVFNFNDMFRRIGTFLANVGRFIVSKVGVLFTPKFIIGTIAVVGALSWLYYYFWPDSKPNIGKTPHELRDTEPSTSGDNEPEKPIREDTIYPETPTPYPYIDMIEVLGGGYTMGGGYEPYMYDVDLSDFWISRTEITEHQWYKVMAPEVELVAYRNMTIEDLIVQQSGETLTEMPDYIPKELLRTTVGKFLDERANYPITGISYHQAVEFCEKLSDLTGDTYRLPTEAEWEYAASGGQLSCGYTYSGSNNVNEVAHYAGNLGIKQFDEETLADELLTMLGVGGPRLASPVGTMNPNELDICDMSGNVAEYCSDFYINRYQAVYHKMKQPISNPTGPSFNEMIEAYNIKVNVPIDTEEVIDSISNGFARVKRGGDYSKGSGYCRVCDRQQVRNPNDGSDQVGFRIVCIPKHKKPVVSKYRGTTKTVVIPMPGCTGYPADDEEDSDGEDDDEEGPGEESDLDETYLILDQSGLVVDSDGGNFEVGYTIVNPKVGFYPVTVTGERNWVRCDVKPGTASGTINIRVSRFAQSKSRSTTIIVDYEDGPHELVVVQNGKTSHVELQRLTETVNGVEFDILLISDGSGDSSGGLGKFYMAETEVTQALWLAVMGDYGDRDMNFGVGDDYPMYRISYDDVVAFCKKLNAMPRALSGKVNYALPTKAQWEYAARGGSASKGYKYCGSNDINEVAWYRGNSYVDGENRYTAHPVKSLNPNELGLYDMSGSVWEWCRDNVFTGSDESKFIRGGCWSSVEGQCEIEYSSFDDRNIALSTYGFRLVTQ